MSKKDFLKILDISSFVALVIATILAVIFQFGGSATIIKVAVVMYSVSFLIMTAFYALQTYFAYAKTMENETQIVNLNKKQKGYLITKLVLCSIVSIFTLVLVIVF